MRGAFSLVLADRSQLVGARDPNGFRPLCLGKLDEGWVLASESPALDITGAHFVRELEPGEVLVIDADGCRSFRPWPAERVQPTLCLFEFVYLARPDSRLYGQELHGARVRMGELLAEQAPVSADIVVGVPDSGMPAAEGYSRRSGIPYGHGLVKNRYIGRTFINPDPGQRALGVRRKLNPLKDAITGKKLIVVDDSIVRGTTTRAMVAMLREAGPGRSICASRRRPTVGRASTAWTPGRAPNWWRLTSRWARSATTSAPTASLTCPSTP